MSVEVERAKELVEKIRGGHVPFLVDVVALPEPHRTQGTKALPKTGRWKVKVNPALVEIKARLQEKAKRARPPRHPDTVLPNVKIKNDEVVSVSFLLDGSTETVKAGEIDKMDTGMAFFAMTQFDIASGEMIALVVDEGFEGEAVKVADGGPDENKAVVKEATIEELVRRAMRAPAGDHRIFHEKEGEDKGYWFGRDVESGLLLGVSKKDMFAALDGQQVAVADALRAVYGSGD